MKPHLFCAPTLPNGSLGQACILATLATDLGYLVDWDVHDYNGDGLLDVMSVFREFCVPLIPQPGIPPPCPFWSELRLGVGGGRLSAAFVLPLGSPLVQLGGPPVAGWTGHSIVAGGIDQDRDGDREPVLVIVIPMSSSPVGLSIIPNVSLIGQGCPGSGGLAIPQVPGAPPIIGDAGFALRLTQAAPGSSALMAASMGIAAGPCGQAFVDLTPGQLVGVPSIFSHTVVRPNGEATLPLPIPLSAALVGLHWYAQWGVIDPTVTLGYSLSPVRKYIITP